MPAPRPSSIVAVSALALGVALTLAGLARADGSARRLTDPVEPPSSSRPSAGILRSLQPALHLTQLTSPPYTILADASASQDTIGTQVAGYTFNFGDSTDAVATTAPTATAQHNYAGPGAYTVRLTITDSGGLTSSPVLATITVAEPDFAPVASLNATQLTTPALTVHADGSASSDADATPIASYAFDFGDGSAVMTTVAPNAIADHTYAAPGPYTVTLTVIDTANHVSSPATALVNVVADDPPVAALAVTQLAAPPLTVSADAAGSSDTDLTPIASYSFDFGDTTPVAVVNAPSTGAQHTYALAGPRTVTVIATDTGGHASAPVAKYIDVAAPDLPPVAVLTVTQLGTPPLTVLASAAGSTDTDATPIGVYQYDFGDGSPVVITTAPIDSVVHTYAAPGTYTVKLVAVDTGDQDSNPAIVHFNVLAPDFPPVAALTVTQLGSPALTVLADASASADTDATPIASYHFDFGDGTAAVTITAPTATAQHTYAAAGQYTVTLTATDTGGHTSAPATSGIHVTAPVQPVTVETRVNTSSDDAEEYTSDTSVHLTSSTLQLIHDSVDQVVGMRWAGLSIPAGATITNAYIQFYARTSQNGATSLALRAQAADNAGTFQSNNGDISTRPRTAATTNWTPTAWTQGEVNANERTPDMTAVVQEVVSRAGWGFGHALVVIVTGSGARTAYSEDGSSSRAPLLHVEFIPPPDLPPVAHVSVSQLASPPLTVNADGSASTDNDATPIASYQFDFGDGTPVVTTTAPTASAQHTYAAAGPYTVTLTAIDSGSLTSLPASASVNVAPPGPQQIAVYAGYYDTHHAVNPKPKPDPWRNSPNTVFVGQQDNQPNDPPGGGWDTSCMRVDNLTAGTLNNVVVSVDVGSHHYALWGTNSIPPGYHLIMAQTVYENFDVGDNYPAGCYGCDTTLCTTMRSNDVPMIHVTIGSSSADYPDTAQTINTDGYDSAGCPYVGGPLPQTRYDESRQWVQVYPANGFGLKAVPVGPGGARAASAASAPAGAHPADTPAVIERAVPRVVSLAPPSPNPARGEVALRFTIAHQGPAWLGVYDLSGRLVQRCLNSVLQPGEYTVRFAPAHPAPGMYFVRLWTPEASRFEKFVLVN